VSYDLDCSYLTQQYARWSSTLNKKIRTDLGDANGVATEAIVNIRTVKAFSTEDLEEREYNMWTRAALTKGMKDAMASVSP
jgi:ABC-type multidrug transport system fused ATPase/permease subunit